jgi:polyhydroxyalkanoate synthesis regulator protein
VDKILRLTKEMESALVDNRADAVAELASRLQVAVKQLAAEARTNPSVKAQLQARLEEIKRQMALNEQLLQQALQYNHALISALLKRRARIQHSV